MRVALLFVLAGLAACVSQAPPPAVAPSPVSAPAPTPLGLLVAPAPPGPSVGYTPAARTKETGCQAKGPLPDAACTPGAVMTTDLETICHQATGPRRNVPQSTHREAFTDYGYTYPQARGAFEVDHLVPLELGGDNVIANLWAEPATPTPGFHEKDRVENYLHRQVCSGAMPLADAQREIATDWIAVWRQIKDQGATEAPTSSEGE
jgi:hypothetical protein